MSFGTAQTGNVYNGDVQRVCSGGALADWQLANTSLQTVNTNVLLNLGHATAYTTVYPISIPAGVTRMWIRGAVGTAATTFTTDPIVVVVGADGNGIPQRLDTDDSDAAGVTLDFQASTAVFTADSKLWTDVYGGSSGYDTKGNRTIYVLVATAAAITDGASPVTASAYVKFGN